MAKQWDNIEKRRCLLQDLGLGRPGLLTMECSWFVSKCFVASKLIMFLYDSNFNRRCNIVFAAPQWKCRNGHCHPVVFTSLIVTRHNNFFQELWWIDSWQRIQWVCHFTCGSSAFALTLHEVATFWINPQASRASFTMLVHCNGFRFSLILSVTKLGRWQVDTLYQNGCNMTNRDKWMLLSDNRAAANWQSHRYSWYRLRLRAGCALHGWIQGEV